MKKSTRFRLAGLLGTLAGVSVSVSVAGAQTVASAPATSQSVVYPSSALDSTHRRPRAIEYSDWYARRLLVHRIGSYTMLPLFATEYYLGNKLLNGDGTDSEKNAHVVVATGLGALFTINTVTGLWNLYDSRQDPTGRKKKIVHSALMIAADAGFAWAGAIGGGARENSSTRSLHKNIALGSMGISTVGAAMMWFWRD